MAQVIKEELTGVTEVEGIIPVSKMLEYKARGFSLAKIAKTLGCSKQNVHRRLQPYKEHIEGLEAYKERKADILNLKASMLLEALTPSTIKDMSGYQLVGSYGILSDKARLEEGKSTSNVSLVSVSLKLAEGLGGLKKDLNNLPDL